MTNQSAEELAFAAYGKGNYEKAYPLLSQLADQGDVHALLAVGWMSEIGVVGIPDAEIARKCYQSAADFGSADAINRLGRLFLSEGDIVRARSTFELGAEREITPCMCHLGLLLIRNPENRADYEKGIEWLKKAASRGHLFSKRKILSIEWSSTRSIIRRFCIALNFLWLTVLLIKQVLLNRNSELLA